MLNTKPTRFPSSLFYLLLLLPLASLRECPTLDCADKSRDDGLCFNHSSTNPSTTLTFYPCPTDQLCDIDYTKSNQMAWINSTQQYYASGTDKNLSGVYMRQTEAYCVSREKFKVNLLAGRQCMHNA